MEPNQALQINPEAEVKDCCQSEQLSENNLESGILKLLGDEPVNKAVEGPPIHTAIVSRWTSVLKNGLSEETSQELLQKHPIPGNFRSLQVPKLNPEVSAALSPQLLRRDERLVQKQQLLTSSISAIAGTLSLMVEGKEGVVDQHIQSLSNAGRLLCNLHHADTITRRELISINLNKDLKDTLTDAPIGTLLFGEALEERVKAAKNLEKSSEELKQPRPKIFKKLVRSSLNSRSPAQLQKGVRAGQTYGRTPLQRQHQKSNRDQQRPGRKPRDPTRFPREKYPRHQR